MCERVLSVLFEVWLLACGKSFPSPPLWKTLRISCQAWYLFILMHIKYSKYCVLHSCFFQTFSCKKSIATLLIYQLNLYCRRHRGNLFDQWNKINLLLTGRVLTIMYGPEYSKSRTSDTNLYIIKKYSI